MFFLMHVMCDICTERRRKKQDKTKKTKKNEKKKNTKNTKTNTFQVQKHKTPLSVVQVTFQPASSLV